MRCEILEKDKIICLYLSRDESNDTNLKRQLTEYCAEQSKAGFKVALLHSGEGDIVQDTISLLKYNKELTLKTSAKSETEIKQAG